MEVVEHEDERTRVCELLEQRANGPVAAVALVLERQDAGRRERRERGEDVCELGANVFVQTVQATRVEPPQVLVERVDEDRERQISLELRSRARQDEPSQCIRPSRELREQAGFPHSRLPDQLDRGCPALIDLDEGPIEGIELLDAAHEVVG